MATTKDSPTPHAFSTKFCSRCKTLDVYSMVKQVWEEIYKQRKEWAIVQKEAKDHDFETLTPLIISDSDSESSESREEEDTGQPDQPRVARSWAEVDPNQTINFHRRHYDDTEEIVLSATEGCSLCQVLLASQEQLRRDPVWRQCLPWDPEDREIFLQLTAELNLVVKYPTAPFMTIVTMANNDSYGPSLAGAAVGLFADPGHLPPGSDLFSGRILPSNFEAENCSATVQQWIKECSQFHKTCTARQSTLPTRLIDVGNKSQHPRLVDTKNKKGYWVALSYCWGGESSFKLQSTNIERLKIGIPLESFPKTLRDAIIFTRALRCRYLWIDALCIIQDSHSDWVEESSKIRAIYRGAYLTIAVESAQDTTEGFLKPRNGSQIRCPIPWKHPKAASKDVVYLIPLSGSQYVGLQGTQAWLGYDCKYNSRRWVLQEALLSSRLVVFRPDQLLWVCTECQRNDFGLYQIQKGDKAAEMKLILNRMMAMEEAQTDQSIWKWLPQQKSMEPLGKKAVRNSWYRIVKEYTQRDLTFETDALPAIAGLAQVFQRYSGDEYCAGLWRSTMVDDLHWKLQNQEKESAPPSPTPRATHAAPSYLQPSWSWISVGEPVEPCLDLGEDNEPEDPEAATIVDVTKVLSVRISRKDVWNEFGEITRGTLELCGPFSEIEDPSIGESEPVSDAALLNFHRVVRRYFSNRDGYGLRREFGLKRKEPSMGTFAALVLRLDLSTQIDRVSLLLLQRDAKPDTYRRVGAVSINCSVKGPDHLMTWEWIVGFREDYAKNPWPVRSIKLT